MITSILHININCTNFERSLDFYQKLGSKVARDLGETARRKVNPGLRLPVLIGGSEGHLERFREAENSGDRRRVAARN